MADVELRALTKEFPGGVRALDTLDLTVADGEFFALLGPSGCGKTTLLRTIAGLEAPTSGQVRIGDRDVTGLVPGARDVAMVFQDYALFPHMTVLDNIAYPLKIKRQSRPERSGRARGVGANLGLAALMDRRPAALSGGQQQRVALARAVACHPSVFLFDEPLSNLDARLRLEARTFLKRLQRELAVTTIFVTHDQAEALALADRIAVMEAGRIRQVGTPREVFGRPANTFVANFIGSTPMNLLPGVVSGGGVAVAGGTLTPSTITPPTAPGERVIVGVRPEYVSLSTTPVDGALTGEVSIIEHLGAVSLVTVEADGALIGATVPEDREPVPGSRVWLSPAPGRVLIYRESDGELVT
ncbi:ABC transporter ATP-binding protein [Planosporangium mesophilum]|uniref:sn-glycerol-3-phosphate import ATP-binding protein UgpC n=1 Tax=Planosporangium mesophilum TaxID=689768 RepID=A0A8J3TGW3_9ACTN|nr:ABC transporter ATP-binding protein [Planosporangium mesophilum]NJC85053.1 ABC transporter ATP-binding protein [Planosporangium mesophilum]GII24494.1 sn-glycerol-3-phosphate import ATP-binding protein UgpC [Planosporangium mesophilum]